MRGFAGIRSFQLSDASYHGGELDAAIRRWGGKREDWLDLSTGISPSPYPYGELPEDVWLHLPDSAARQALTDAARSFWDVPADAAVLASPGASSIISRIPQLGNVGRVVIPGPTYSEHAAAFTYAGWEVSDHGAGDTKVLVNPNNPTGHLWSEADCDAPLTIVDESFADTVPEASLIRLASQPGRLILKSFGKFWGLAGLRLGFAIGDPNLVNQLERMLGPWPVSGPALEIGTRALQDSNWSEKRRIQLKVDQSRLDEAIVSKGGKTIGGTSLFRLYEFASAKDAQASFARKRILVRTFPYSETWVRIGLPNADAWDRIEADW